ncbi:MAG TPA: MSHA biogenesis protein MshK [Burkholderiaceae bacterium]|nr:MSHA biogenesis protein MshK [Burkholderiaceae bacterium]
MDETVSRPAQVSKRVLAMLPVLLWASCACAQGLPDPTVPPPEARQAMGVAAAPPENKGPQLQSVLVGSNGRQVAVIDGQTVRRGEKFNGALLVRVDKNHAVLRRGSHTQVLTLYPDSTERSAKADKRQITNMPMKQPAPEPAPQPEAQPQPARQPAQQPANID